MLFSGAGLYVLSDLLSQLATKSITFALLLFSLYFYVLVIIVMAFCHRLCELSSFDF